jgi:hypothetical protein
MLSQGHARARWTDEGRRVPNANSISSAGATLR